MNGRVNRRSVKMRTKGGVEMRNDVLQPQLYNSNFSLVYIDVLKLVLNPAIRSQGIVGFCCILRRIYRHFPQHPFCTHSHKPSPPIPSMPAFKSRSVCVRGACGLLFASTLLALVPPSCSETKSIVNGTTKGATLPWCLGPPFFLTLYGLWCTPIFTILHTSLRKIPACL